MSYGASSNLSGGFGGAAVGAGGNRSPRSSRRLAGELPTVDRSPSRTSYGLSGGGATRGSPLGSRKGARSPPQAAADSQHAQQYQQQQQYHSAPSASTGYMGSPYYATRDDELGSPVMMDDRGRGHHRSRSASRPAMGGGGGGSTRYQSLDRGGLGADSHEREFVPIREPRERSLDRGMASGRDRSLDRGLYLDDDLYGGGGSRSARQSPNPHMMASGGSGRDVIAELQQQNGDLQRELANFKKELELTNQKLGSSMHSIKTFWSPELKKERALRKEESAKYSLINDQLKLLNSENQKQAMLVRQLEEELRMRMRNPSIEMQQQMEVLYAENEHLTREIAILRETIKELELRIETQKQTLQARDESIKKLLEMLQNKGVGGKMLDGDRETFESLQSRLIESEDKIRHYENLVRNRDQELNKAKRLDEFRTEIQRRDQEILAMSAKMKTLEEQHQDYQRHIAVLKESLCAKEEHYNMLQADVEELRQRLEEKNRHIEKKTVQTQQATQERNRLNNELSELRDHMDIKDRKINVLQRKLDLQEANKKLANGTARAGEEATALRMQLEEQKKQLEDQRRKLEEHKKGLDSKSRQLEEKEKSIADADQKLKKRKEKLDQLEAQLQKGATARGGTAGEVQKRMVELEQQVEAHQKELEKAKEDAQRSQVEMERLLQLVQMSQEEQNAKEKTIRDLQEALKNAQAKVRSQQASAHAERRDEVEMQDKAVETNGETVSENASEVTETVHEEQVTTVSDDQHAEFKELKEELEKRGQKVSELEREISVLETALQENANIAELEELVLVVRQKDDRIEELQEALRESVRITAEREKVLQQESTRRKQIMEKVGKLEQRLLSLQTAHALRCSSCRPLVGRLQELEQRLRLLTTERRQHLQDLSRMKQEALEAALSEKDAHLALLEVSGIRTARQAEEADQLRADRKRLMEKLREENEQSVRLLQEYSLPDSQQFVPSEADNNDTVDTKKETTTSNHNGNAHQEEEIDQDSLEPLSPDSTLSM